MDGASRFERIERRIERLAERFYAYRENARDRDDRLDERIDKLRDDVNEIKFALKFINGRNVPDQQDTAVSTEDIAELRTRIRPDDGAADIGSAVESASVEIQ